VETDGHLSALNFSVDLKPHRERRKPMNPTAHDVSLVFIELGAVVVLKTRELE